MNCYDLLVYYTNATCISQMLEVHLTIKLSEK